MSKPSDSVKLTSNEILEGYLFCQERIKELWSKGYRNEAVLYMSVLVEFFTKKLIIRFEKMVEDAAFEAHIAFDPRKLYSKPNIENQPLGPLVRILGAYTKDKRLIADLDRFLQKRNMCVHKILQCKADEINRDLTGFDQFFLKLIWRLMELNTKQMDHGKKSMGFARVAYEKGLLPCQIKF